MSNYVLAFRGRSDRTAGADEVAEWGNWFGELGGTVVDFGSRVGRVTALGDCGAANGGDVLTGYVVIAADDLESAVSLAKGCPALVHGGGVEVGEHIQPS